MESIASSTAVSNKSTNLVVSAAVVAHAAVVTTLWWLMIYADRDLVSVRLWTLLAVAWFAWPVTVIVRWSRFSKLVVGATVAGIAVISPVISTLYTFAAWAIGGFAP